MDSESSSVVSKVFNEIKSDFGFEEAVTQLLIKIGLKIETTFEEFFLRSIEIVPELPLTYAISIFDTIRQNLPHLNPKNSAGSDFPEPNRVFHTTEESHPSQNGWLSRMASSRTAFLKINLIDPVPRTSRFPAFESKEEIFDWRESRALIVTREAAPIAAEAHWCYNKAQDKISAVKRAKREVICGVRDEISSDDLSLIRRILADESLSGCSSLVISEARRRTANTDILLGLLKNLFRRRPDFYLIFDSDAVFDANKLSAFFSGCRVMDVTRFPFPVKILYSKKPISDYLEAAAILTVEIHMAEGDPNHGDILVYLAGDEDIDPVHRLIIERLRMIRRHIEPPELVVWPVFYIRRNNPRLLLNQPRVWPPGRRVILTASKAEALFEFENIRFVVDCGFEKRVSNNPKLLTNTMSVAPISRDLAARRGNRASRSGPGKCYRLYTEIAFLMEMGPTTAPEIQRTNLGEAVLRAKALGIFDLSSFHFVDCPPLDSIVRAREMLYSLRALDERWDLTSLGRSMAEFPVGPVHSKILMISARIDFRCSEEALTVVAMVQIGNVFNRPEEEERRAEADLKRVGFFRPEGDHLTMLAVFEGWRENGFSSQWCLDNFVDFDSMNRAYKIRNQLISIMDRLKLEIVSAEKNYMKIAKAITAGLFFHVATWDPQEGCYQALSDNRRLHINSRSALFQRQPLWVVFEDLHVMSDDKEYMIGVTAIDADWIIELVPRRQH